MGYPQPDLVASNQFSLMPNFFATSKIFFLSLFLLIDTIYTKIHVFLGELKRYLPIHMYEWLHQEDNIFSTYRFPTLHTETQKS